MNKTLIDKTVDRLFREGEKEDKKRAEKEFYLFMKVSSKLEKCPQCGHYKLIRSMGENRYSLGCKCKATYLVVK